VGREKEWAGYSADTVSLSLTGTARGLQWLKVLAPAWNVHKKLIAGVAGVVLSYSKIAEVSSRKDASWCIMKGMFHVEQKLE